MKKRVGAGWPAQGSSAGGALGMAQIGYRGPGVGFLEVVKGSSIGMEDLPWFVFRLLYLCNPKEMHLLSSGSVPSGDSDVIAERRRTAHFDCT